MPRLSVSGIFSTGYHSSMHQAGGPDTLTGLQLGSGIFPIQVVPSAALEIQDSTIGFHSDISQVSIAPGTPTLWATSVRNTIAAPQPTQVNDGLWTLSVRGYDGVAYRQAGRITFVQEFAVAGGFIPTTYQLYIGTTNVGVRAYHKVTPLVGGGAATQIGSGFTALDELNFFGGASATKRTSGANLTNNVTVGGVDDTIADIAIGGVVGADVRNALYQLARKLKQINDGLRAYGLFT